MDLMDARKQFADEAASYRASRGGSNNSFGAFIDKKDNYVYVGNWVCHGWLKQYEIERRSWLKHGAKYVLSAVMKPHMDKDDVPIFIDWLVNRSPYAAVFVDKDVQSILKYGYLVDADHPSQFIASALMASRFPTEAYTGSDTFARRCLVWKELLTIGCTENEAYFFAHMYNAASVKNVFPITPSRLGSGHNPFYGYQYGEGYVRNFLNATPQIPKGARRLSEGYGYPPDSIDCIWGRQISGEAFWTVVQGLAPKVATAGKDYNIFRRIKREGLEYRNREDFKSVIDQLREVIYRV